MEFYRLPIGHAEWRVDSRDPRAARRRLEEMWRNRHAALTRRKGGRR